MSDPASAAGAVEPGAEGPMQAIPFSAIVGQDAMKLALKLAYVHPAIGGLLLTGERGTGKSTIVRAFARAVYGDERALVVLPINATEDRVVGGWDVTRMVRDVDAVWRDGLLLQANDKLLYIDEVNLLDDHIVNIILDVAAGGELVVQREGQDLNLKPRFTMIGTMNPEEGELRPQLLDRFDLHVQVHTETERRVEVLTRMLELDRAMDAPPGDPRFEVMGAFLEQDREMRKQLEFAKKLCGEVVVGPKTLETCSILAEELKADGHRGEAVLARAAQAYVAIQAAKRKSDEPGAAPKHLRVEKRHLRQLVALAFRHRSRLVKKGNADGNPLDEVANRLLG
jgi:magnesium chelatase subunit I